MTIALSVDLGTTYLKATLIDDTGRLLALSREPTPIERPHAGWSEIQPAVFTDCLRRLIHGLREQDATALRQTAVIGYATQANSFVLLDERDEPVTPLVLWNDQRAEALEERVQAWWNDTGSYGETGIPAVGSGFAAAKLLWMQEHEPAAWRRARRMRLISDQWVAWLTGREVTEAGAAGLTGLVDVHQLRWRAAALAALGLDKLRLPAIARAGAELGPVRPALAGELGLPRACRVMLGCLDQYAGAIGAGNVQVDGVSETTGTVLATVRLADRFDPDLRAHSVFQGPAWRAGLYWQMRFGSVSANLLEALRQGEAGEGGEGGERGERRAGERLPSYETLTGEAAGVPAGAEGVRLDAAASERAGRPIFTGLGAAHGRGHRVRAVLECVAEALRGQVDELFPRQRPAQMQSVGGAARSDLWLQIKADTLGMPVAAMDCPEPTCLGAAALALAGAADTPVERLTGDVVRCRRVFRPATADMRTGR